MAGRAGPLAPRVPLSAPARVLGWDLLRGLCALSVMAYHLMGWQDLAHVSPLGTYGVYLFFILSGASLAYAYDAQALSTRVGFCRFLWVRWMRLAPLYLLLCAVWLAMLAAHRGAWTDHIPLRLALNASFAFGLHDPVTWALLVGGWSLGIECVFYLCMPWLLRWVQTPAWRWSTLCALVGVQAAWVAHTVGREGLAAATVAYHQVPAFGAWFFAGCMIGHWQRGGVIDLRLRAGLTLWTAMGALLVLLATATPGAELVGWRGAVLAPACVLTVWASGRVRLDGAWARVAAWLGDITYGAYLLHPVLFFGLSWFLLPRGSRWAVEALPLAGRVAVLLGVGSLTVLVAMGSERYLERPLRRAARPVRPATGPLPSPAVASNP